MLLRELIPGLGEWINSEHSFVLFMLIFLTVSIAGIVGFNYLISKIIRK